VEICKTILINTEQLKQFLSKLIMIDTMLFQAFFIKFYVNFLFWCHSPHLDILYYVLFNTKLV